MTWLYNGRRINEQSAWTDDNGTQHPANWGLWSEEEKAAIGLVWIQPQQRPDERFYHISDNSDGTFHSIPKDLQKLKEDYVQRDKQTCSNMLKDTDWQVIAQVERGRVIPDNVKQYRAGIIAACNARENSYNSATTFEDFVTLVSDHANLADWPILDQVVQVDAQQPS